MADCALARAGGLGEVVCVAESTRGALELAAGELGGWQKERRRSHVRAESASEGHRAGDGDHDARLAGGRSEEKGVVEELRGGGGADASLDVEVAATSNSGVVVKGMRSEHQCAPGRIDTTSSLTVRLLRQWGVEIGQEAFEWRPKLTNCQSEN